MAAARDQLLMKTLQSGRSLHRGLRVSAFVTGIHILSSKLSRSVFVALKCSSCNDTCNIHKNQYIFFAFVEICHEKIGPCKIRTFSETIGVQPEVDIVNREYTPFVLTSGQDAPNTVIVRSFYHIGLPFKSSPLLGLIGGCRGGGVMKCVPYILHISILPLLVLFPYCCC